MAKTEKFIPKDSEQLPRQTTETNEDAKAKRKGSSTSEMGNPATKRTYSEQPPTKRNAKT